MQQILRLAQHLSDHELSQMRFSAALQGVDFDKMLKAGKKVQQQLPPPTQTNSPQEGSHDELMFQHPDYYKNWTQEQREEATKKMMARLVPWAKRAI